jgi:hypothetical protein
MVDRVHLIAVFKINVAVCTPGGRTRPKGSMIGVRNSVSACSTAAGGVKDWSRLAKTGLLNTPEKQRTASFAVGIMAAGACESTFVTPTRCNGA